MAKEIERKFLVDHTLLPNLHDIADIRQGYLSFDPEVRVRLTDGAAYLTIKSGFGLVRQEFEYAIPVSDAVEILQLCGSSVINKTRYRLTISHHLWEIDQFHDKHRGLWLAEVELDSLLTNIKLPNWINREVTGDRRFSNGSLVQMPGDDFSTLITP